MKNKRWPVRVCSRIGIALLAAVAAWLIATVLFQAVLMLVAPAFLESPWALWILNDLPLYAAGLPVFLLIVHFIPDGPQEQRPPAAKFGLLQFLTVLLFCLGATYLLNLLSSGLIYLLQQVTGGSGSSALDTLANSGGILAAILFGAVVPAVGEEFIFRHMLRRKLRGSGDTTYIFFSALCFALFHGNLSQLFYAFVIGLAFAWVYLQTGKLWVTMLLHFLINLVGMVVLPMVVVPAVGDNELLLGLLGLGMLALMGGGIAVFAVHLRRVRQSLLPPIEPGWPRRKRPVAAAWQPYSASPYAYAPPTMPAGPMAAQRATNGNFAVQYPPAGGQTLAPPPAEPAHEPGSTMQLPDEPVLLSQLLAQNQPVQANGMPTPPQPVQANAYPYAPQAGATAQQPWQQAPFGAAPYEPVPSVKPSRLVLNLGMILYMLLAAGMMAVTLLTMIGLQ